jgi:pimeloyl-ACP methyl ester carboxylesterase/uncharacterized protein YndB with AHSA1/START domain
MERLFDCTPEELWDAWTIPEEFARWISPFAGLDAEVPEFDARLGGRLVFIMVGPDGERFYEEGYFEVFNRPHELVIYQPHENRDDFFDGFPLTMRAQFVAEGAQTRLIFEHSGYPMNFPMDEAHHGFSAVFDKLAVVTTATVTQGATPTPATITSKDGTAIAYEHAGSGPVLLLVDGAMCSRTMGPMEDIAKLLIPHYTVYRYDRRGRGQSGDTKPYAPAREIEDIEALIQAAGGSAYVLGISSGAALALEAANQGLGITKLALFEAPFFVDATRQPLPEGYLERLESHIAHDRRSEAAKMFLTVVGMPWFMLLIMPLTPAWKKIKAVSHTLPYDARILAGLQAGQPLPRDRWLAIDMPTLVLDGGKSPPWMRNASKALADVLPGAKYQTLPDQTHMVKAPVLAPVLVEFFGA